MVSVQAWETVARRGRRVMKRGRRDGISWVFEVGVWGFEGLGE